jgi:L-alanine-DL-glutamate epimerase-like enolase superfamily enzyme
VKIARIETFLCDAGWRPWIFCKVTTDDGMVGWGECSDGRNPHSVIGAIRDYEPALIGQDPRAVEKLYWDMFRIARQNLGGTAHKGIAGVELALWDIKARALGIPVYELFGGPLRDRVRLYWSHCGTSRVRYWQQLGVPPLRSYEDIAALGREVVSRGFTALKTNIVIPGDPARVYSPGFDAGGGTNDGVVSAQVLSQIERVIGTFRDAVGPQVGLCLDVNYNFRTEGVQRVAKLLEQFDMQWLEYDNWDPVALRQIKDSTSTRICSGESLVTSRQYRPFLEMHAMDVAMVDVPWNGFSASRAIASMADAFEINVAPHNYYSHLSTLHSAHLCAITPNVRISEVDIDDVAWKDDLITTKLEIVDGHLIIPTGPGWGAAVDEEVLRAHPWPAPTGRTAAY